jgi:citrate synthase
MQEKETMEHKELKKSRKTALRTEISWVQPGKILIKGYDLIEMIGKKSFGDIVYLLFTGELPKRNESRMIEAILVASCEHGMATPSTNVARSVASGGVPLQAAVAAGIIGMGDYHGGAIEQCARMLQENMAEARERGFEETAKRIITECRASKKRILGYGHGIHEPEDPRKVRLFQYARDLKVAGDHITFSEVIESQLWEFTKKDLPINVDGAIGAIISDLGIHWTFGKGFFFIARSAGLTAHAQEERAKEPPMRRVYTWDEVNYQGPRERQLP